MWPRVEEPRIQAVKPAGMVPSRLRVPLLPPSSTVPVGLPEIVVWVRRPCRLFAPVKSPPETSKAASWTRKPPSTAVVPAVCVKGTEARFR